MGPASAKSLQTMDVLKAECQSTDRRGREKNFVRLDCQCMGPASAKHTVQLGKAAEARGFLQLLPLSRAAEIRQIIDAYLDV